MNTLAQLAGLSRKYQPRAWTRDELNDALAAVWDTTPDQIDVIPSRIGGGRRAYWATDKNGHGCAVRHPYPTADTWMIEDGNIAQQVGCHYNELIAVPDRDDRREAYYRNELIPPNPLY